MEQPAAGKSADTSQQDIEQDTLTSPIYKLAANKSRGLAEKYPS
jgi:hypothetical protein